MTLAAAKGVRVGRLQEETLTIIRIGFSTFKGKSLLVCSSPRKFAGTSYGFTCTDSPRFNPTAKIQSLLFAIHDNSVVFITQICYLYLVDKHEESISCLESSEFGSHLMVLPLSCRCNMITCHLQASATIFGKHQWMVFLESLKNPRT